MTLEGIKEILTIHPETPEPTTASSDGIKNKKLRTKLDPITIKVL